MSAARRMLETYPRDLGRIDRAKLVACIDACIRMRPSLHSVCRRLPQ